MAARAKGAVAMPTHLGLLRFSLRLQWTGIVGPEALNRPDCEGAAWPVVSAPISLKDTGMYYKVGRILRMQAAEEKNGSARGCSGHKGIFL